MKKYILWLGIFLLGGIGILNMSLSQEMIQNINKTTNNNISNITDIKINGETNADNTNVENNISIKELQNKLKGITYKNYKIVNVNVSLIISILIISFLGTFMIDILSGDNFLKKVVSIVLYLTVIISFGMLMSIKDNGKDNGEVGVSSIIYNEDYFYKRNIIYVIDNERLNIDKSIIDINHKIKYMLKSLGKLELDKSIKFESEEDLVNYLIDNDTLRFATFVAFSNKDGELLEIVCNKIKNNPYCSSIKINTNLLDAN